MHICLLTSGRPFEIFYGGEEKFTRSFAEWLLTEGCTVTIVGRNLFFPTAKRLFSDSKFIPETKQRGPRTLRLPYPIYASCLLVSSILTALLIVSINRKERISVIHAQDTGYSGLSAIVSAKLLKLPAVISSHGLRYVTLRKNLTWVSAKISLPFEHWLDTVSTRNCDLTIPVSSSEIDYFARLGLRKGKIKSSPIGIKTCDFDGYEETRESQRKEFRIHENFAIGFVGRFSKEKNLITLIEAFAEATKCVSKMKLVLVGTGPLERELKLLAHKKAIDDKVIFTGVQYEMNRVLSALDIFVLPSYTEGCPTSLLEAMAAGKAIVASNIPSIKEIAADEKVALLFNPYSSEQLKETILGLYNNPQLRRELGENARMAAKQYDLKVVYPRLLTFYQEILSQNYEERD